MSSSLSTRNPQGTLILLEDERRLGRIDSSLLVTQATQTQL
uniref:Uncharacterized protein n=1 Tax=Zea mays TaxID=4577 RepID=C4J248_MAIZE|nr:unknown [Zea mays]